MSKITAGYRGYIGSRPYGGDRTAQHVQNLVIRDFCQRNGFPYLLSATEYAMEGSYVVLNEVLREAENINGIVLYSIFMLPQDRARRLSICHAFLDKNATIHGALENLSITNQDDLSCVDEMLLLNEIITRS